MVLNGTRSRICTIESCQARGFSGLQILGVNNESARNVKERVATTLEQLGLKISNQKIVINCSPGEAGETQHHFDLPMAMTLFLLHAKEEVRVSCDEVVFCGELSLDGRLKAIHGTIGIALEAIQKGFKKVVLPSANRFDIETLQGQGIHQLCEIEFFYFNSLQEVLNWVISAANYQNTPAAKPSTPAAEPPNFDDMTLSREQQTLAAVCAVGRHSLLLEGTPGTGKSMFASRMASLLPKPSQAESLYLMSLYSALGPTIPMPVLMGQAPFRSPHHTSSAAAILGTPKQPGDFTLANGGVLFLDEFPEFRRDLIEALREPLETGEIKVSRAQAKTSWKAKPLLLAAANQCPCGWLGSKKKLCRCSQQSIQKYQRKLSGPILDRIDLHFLMPEQDSHLQLLADKQEHHQGLKRLVEKSFAFGRERNQRMGILYNSEIPSDRIMKACQLSPHSPLVERLANKEGSMRRLIKTLRVARTIADLNQKTKCWRRGGRKSASIFSVTPLCLNSSSFV